MRREDGGEPALAHRWRRNSSKLLARHLSSRPGHTDCLIAGAPGDLGRRHPGHPARVPAEPGCAERAHTCTGRPLDRRSEEHTSELQSLAYLVCRLLLEKKKKNKIKIIHNRKKK